MKVPLAYTRVDDVLPEAPVRAARRARPIDHRRVSVEESCHLAPCRVVDLLDESEAPPDVRRQGFEVVDLARASALQAALAEVRAADDLDAGSIARLRRAVRGAPILRSDGSRLHVLFAAAEGVILRKAGPNGIRVDAHRAPAKVVVQDGAFNVHIDQDVDGTPIRQILRGAAPWLFHHHSPRGSNTRSPLFLLNLWIPLVQVTRPLVLMDGRTLDRPRDQLRYGLETEGILEREGDRRVNDIWTLLHDPAHRWFFSSEMGPTQAYAFETLSTPHGSMALPGEDVAARRYRQLEAARAAVAAGDAAALARALDESEARVPRANEVRTTAALGAALADMDGVVAAARERPAEIPKGPRREPWCFRARAAMDAVVRRSVEMRVVAWVGPDRRAPRQLVQVEAP